MKRLKTLLRSDFDFFYLALLIILYCLISLNLYFILPFLAFLIYFKKYEYYNYLLLCLVIFIGIGFLKDTLSINKTEGYFYVMKSFDNSSILNGAVVYEKLDKYSVYYLKGNKKEFVETTVFNEFSSKNYYKAKGANYILEDVSYQKIYTFKMLNYFGEYLEDLRIGDLEKNYLKTVVLGDKSLDESIDKAYKDLGVSHIFSISGLHITYLSVLILGLLKKFFSENSAYLILITFLGFYLVISGFSASIFRASLFFVIKYLMVRIKVDFTNLNALSLTLLISLLINKNLVLDYGFLLSYLSAFVIVIGHQFVKNPLYLSLAAYLVTLPLIINLNNQFSLISPIYNIFYVFFFANFFYVLALVSILGFDLFNFFLEAIYFLEKFTMFLLEYDFSFKTSYIHIIFIFAYYFFLYYFFVNLEKCRSNILGFFAVFLLMVYLVNQINFKKVVMLDVSQGLSIYIYDGKESYLYDTGGMSFYDVTKKKVIPYLSSQNIDELNLILSHNHFDHVGGLETVTNNFDINKVYLSKYSDLELISKVKNYDLKLLDIFDSFGNFTVLSPSKSYDDQNDKSLVLFYKNLGKSFILTGDTELKNIYSKADYLFLGHHGSDTSTDVLVLNRVDPKLTFASTNGKFDHPSKSVLNTLDFLEIPLMTTKERGTVYNYQIFDMVITLSHKQLNLVMGKLD